MKKGLLTIVSLFLVALSSTALFGQGTIKGTVRDTKGQPVPYSTVIIEKSGNAARVDELGNYLIENVATGTHSVKAAMIGYSGEPKEAIVSTGQTTSLDFILTDKTTLNEVVVTGVVNPKSALESSISISTLKPSQIAEAAPRTTAEIFRSIPGIRSEASGGDGNTNITVRGVPIATGGSKFLQLQEDGLPVLQFGDIAFATADMFLRADNTISRIESLRGGSASTLASNSPAGLINFISKTGATEGGSLANTVGIDFRSYRTDFEYGTPLSNNMTFHIGGFYRQGDGPRKTHFTSNNGGQIKANLTKYFNKGYARFYFKYLNDRAAAYMPMPIQVEGTNSNPTWSSVEGYDALHGALQSPNLLSNIGTGANGELRRSDVADGMHTVSTAVGSEFSFEVGNGWNVLNKTRFAFNNGGFIAPFPAEVAKQDALATSIAGAGYQLTYANSGQAAAANLNGNGLLMRMHLFDTQLNNFDNFTNDFNLSKSVGKAKINAGIYKAYQTISMSWVWNSYLTDVNDEGIQLMNLTNAAGDTSFTDNGLLAYGVPAWGNCCHRNYDTKYDITAPYAGVEIQLTDNLSADGSVRYDMGNVYGSYAGGDGQTRAYDVNGDGTISYVESNVATIDNANAKPVNYDYNYVSYSFGANYLLNKEMAVFARYSSGGRANADRLLFGPFILADGKAASGLSSDMVNQAELGYKLRKNNYNLNATAFLANVEEQNYEATTQKSVNREYQSIGLELDGGAVIKAFEIRGGLTYTKAEIKKDALNKTVEGNTPRRQAPIIFSLVPSYHFRNHSAGFSIIGTGKSYTQDDNKLVMPGYAYVNLFINLAITSKLSLSINGNNILDQMGITEAEESSIVENSKNIIRGRSITGRSFSSTLKFSF